MHTFSGKRVQISRQCGNQSFSFSSAHFSDCPGIQSHTTEKLHIEMALTQRATRGFTDDRESFRKNLLENFIDSVIIPAKLVPDFDPGVGVHVFGFFLILKS